MDHKKDFLFFLSAKARGSEFVHNSMSRSSLRSDASIRKRIKIFYRQRVGFHEKFKMLRERNCIFVHIPKAAGTSIVELLYGFPRTYGHHKWWYYFHYFGEQTYLSMFKFTVVRNPYERLVSAFHYLKEGGNNPTDARFRDTHLRRVDSISSLCDLLVTDQAVAKWIHFEPQHRFVYDRTGQCAVDQVLHLERIDSELPPILKRLNVVGELPRKNASNHAQFLSYLDPYTVAKINQFYGRDFDLFGYERL